MLYLALQPSQQVAMAPYRYPFLNDAEVALKMIGRKRGEKTHGEKLVLYDYSYSNGLTARSRMFTSPAKVVCTITHTN